MKTRAEVRKRIKELNRFLDEQCEMHYTDVTGDEGAECICQAQSDAALELLRLKDRLDRDDFLEEDEEEEDGEG